MPPALSSEWTGFLDAPARRSSTTRDRMARLAAGATRAVLHLEAGRRRRLAATSWQIAMWLVPMLLLAVSALDAFFGIKPDTRIQAEFFYALPIVAACVLLGRWGAALVPVCLALCYLNDLPNFSEQHPHFVLNDLMQLATFSTIAALTLLARLFYLDLAVTGQALVTQRRDLEREIALAARLQACLYNVPPDGYRHGSLVVHARCRPRGTVGGDLCHLIPHEEGFTLFVGDVIGKGVPAALIMSMCTAILARSGGRDRSPGRALAECNRLLSRHFDQDPEPIVTATAFCGAFEADAGTLVFSLAGHDTPVFLTDGTAGREPRRGVLMGALDEVEYPEVRAPFSAGSKLVVFTDGAVEIRSPEGEEFGRERLEEAARRWRHLGAEELLERLLEEIDAFAGGAPPRDDLTLVVVEREAG